MSRKLKPVSPGEMLVEEFLEPSSMSNYRLAIGIGVPAQRIGEIGADVSLITSLGARTLFAPDNSRAKTRQSSMDLDS